MTDTPRILGGRYEVGELIGRGGMAEVHLGHDTRLGRTVAIKMLRSDLARDPSFLTRFRREAQSAAGLNHHAVVAVYDSGEDIAVETGGARVDVPYIVMEYVEGETLRDILDDEGKLAPDEAARITMGILSALDYSHEKGIVHRDIKPANVMLTRGGSVKVMDFGIARALADTAATMTSAQAVVGTARYLSPEQAQGETVDARSDLYSAGCVLFELLTGRTPFVGEPVSLVYQHITDQPQAPSVYEPSVPPALDAVTLHSLEKPRGSRYQHAGDFRADLQRARTGEPLSEAAAAMEGAGQPMDREPYAVPAPATRHDPTAEYDESQAPPRRTLIWVAAAIALLAAILGIGYLVMNSGDGTKLNSVPTVVGMTQNQAIATLKASSFDAQVHKVTNDQPIGQVVSQNPSSGDARSGSTVVIDVSGGPNALPIPDLSGQTVDQAKQALKDAGFTNVSVSNQPVDNTQFEQGVVVSTSPATGNSANPSSALFLNVSSGLVTVPKDLTGKTSSLAQTELRGRYLGATISALETSDPGQVDKVIRVSNSGQKVTVNSIITLYVGILRPQASTFTSTVTPPPTTTSTTSTSTPPPTSTSTTTTSSPSSTSTGPTKSGGPPTPGVSTPTP